MKRCAVAGLVALAWVSAGAQPVDPYDHELTVYWLGENQSNAFAVNDGQVSPFWDDDWAGRDYIELQFPGDANPDGAPFTGSDDASVVIKAAADCSGLYLCCIVQDNTWVDRAGSDDYGADAMDLFLDQRSAEEIAICDGCYVGLHNTSLTYGTQQFQVWMGATTPPSSLQYQAYDESQWSWQAATCTFEQLNALLGIGFEVIIMDGTHKAQEWFVPWRSVGRGGQSTIPGPGKRIAMSGGYNDKDGDNTTPGELRWLTKDPWASDAQQVQYWGDLLMASDFGSGGCTMTVRDAAMHAAGGRAQQGVRRMYGLDGRLVDNVAPGPRAVIAARSGASVGRRILLQGGSTGH
jgi:hypothetical protein